MRRGGARVVDADQRRGQRRALAVARLQDQPAGGGQALHALADAVALARS